MRIVLKLGGAVCADPKTTRTLADALVALRANGHQVTIVHGGGPQLDKALSDLGEPLVKHQGLRVTSARAAEVVREVLGAIGQEMTRALAAQGLPVRHVGPAEKRLRASVKKLEDGYDLGRVGTVHGFTLSLRAGSRHDAIRIVTPVGFDTAGPLNVNADEAAAAIATAIRADGLVLATDVDALRGAEGENVHVLAPADVEALIANETATGGMVPKLRACSNAVRMGVEWAWLGKLDVASILAVVDGTHEGGTRITVQPETVKAKK